MLFLDGHVEEYSVGEEKVLTRDPDSGGLLDPLSN